jgi:hypothetical protein
VLNLIDNGVSQQKIAVQFHVAKSTVGKIQKLGAQYGRLGKKMKGKENYEEQLMGMLMV